MNPHSTASIDAMAPNRAAILTVLAVAAPGILGCGHATETRVGMGTTPASPASPPAGAVIQGSYGAPQGHEAGEVQVGFATWYGARFAGRRTASGEPFDPLAMTAAHRTLPFGTWVEVTRMDTGASVRVRITDRGPFGHEDRIIDLSRAAAERLDLVKAGVARVQLRVVDAP